MTTVAGGVTSLPSVILQEMTCAYVGVINEGEKAREYAAKSLAIQLNDC